jgi:hypothetical protein
VTAASVAALVLAGQRDLGGRVSHWLARLLQFPATLLLRPLRDALAILRWHGRRRTAVGGLLGPLAGAAWWILPLLAGAVFALLFALANPIIEEWLREAAAALKQWAQRLPELLRPGRIALWWSVAVTSYALFRYRRRGRRLPPAAPASPPASLWLAGEGLTVRFLLVFNAVFALQTVLDVVYLFGGAALPAGLTYARYAHRGAYPLIATALLAGAFVLYAFRTGGPAHRSAACRRLVYLWIGQNVFLLLSTAWRLGLYIDTYSLTRLRAAAVIWVGLVAAGFGWILLKLLLHKHGAWL